MKKGALRSFAKFTGKHLCQSLFFIKNAGLRPGQEHLLNEHLWTTDSLQKMHCRTILIFGYS